MKAIARSYVYWPGIDKDIETMAKSCVECAKHAHAPPMYRDHHWEYPKGPWERIHIDYAGPVAGTMLLIVVDAYSKWVEVKTTNSMTSQATITILDDLFAAYGSPITVVSDNAKQFIFDEFEQFLKINGVKYHKLSAPYHPSTNGQAERYVETTKDALKKMKSSPGTLKKDINEFLRQYRKAPHSTTGQSPSQLFIGRTLRTRIDLVRPDCTKTKVTEKQQSTFEGSFRTFKKFQQVYFLSGNDRMDKWIPGTILKRLGDLHYEVNYFGTVCKRHVDQILPFVKKVDEELANSAAFTPTDESQAARRHIRFHEGNEVAADAPPSDMGPPEPPVPPPLPNVPENLAPFQPPVTPRRPTRLRKPPSRYSP